MVQDGKAIEGHLHQFAPPFGRSTDGQLHPLAKAGSNLWSEEQDYTGLAAIDPNDGNILYISTTIDPRNGGVLPHHEIFKGTTADQGATWSWNAVTQGSSVDNLRPMTVRCGPENTAVLWLRGKMQTW